MTKANIHRNAARAQGLHRFNTSVPCGHGHLSDRYTASGKCVSCMTQRSARWARENPEKAKAAVSRWEKANPEKAMARAERWKKANPDSAKAATARWRENNPEKVRQWQLNNTEKTRAKWARWREANREKCLKSNQISSSRRRALKRGSGGTHTIDDLREILAAQAGRCAYCKADLRRIKKNVDHIMPLARGGSNGRSNLQYLCQPCNNIKRAKDPLDFAQSLGLLL